MEEPKNLSAGPEVQPKTPEETKLDEARAKYAEAYKQFLAERKEGRKGIKKIANATEYVFGTTIKDGDTPEELKQLEREYDQAAVACGNEMFEDRKKQLEEDTTLSAEQRNDELKRFQQDEIFKKVIVEEQEELTKLKAENLPPKEKAAWKKGVEWYLKQKWYKKLVMSTVLTTGLVLGATAVFASGAVITTGTAVAVGSSRAVSALKSITLSHIGVKGYDLLFKDMSAEKREQLEKELAEKFGITSLDADFSAQRKEYARILEQEKKEKRNRQLKKAAVGMATSLGTSYAMAEGGILGNAHADELDLSKHTVEPENPVLKNVFSDLAPETNHQEAIPESVLPSQKLPDNIIDNASIPKNVGSIFDQPKDDSIFDFGKPKPSIFDQYVSEHPLEPIPKPTPEPVINPDAIVHRGQGVEHAFIKQIENNPELARSLGYQEGIDLHQFAGTQAHRIALEHGYASDMGSEVRIVEADKSAFEIKIKDGKVVVEEKIVGAQGSKTYEYRKSNQTETPTHIEPTPEPAPAPIPKTELTQPRHDMIPDTKVTPEPVIPPKPTAEELKAILEAKYPKSMPINEYAQPAEIKTPVGPLDDIYKNDAMPEKPTVTPAQILNPQTLEVLRMHPEFVLNNPFTLSSQQLAETYNVHYKNINHLLPNNTTENWREVSQFKVKDLLKSNPAEEGKIWGPIVSYAQRLQTESGLKPEDGFIKKETFEHFAARALQKIEADGNLDKIRLNTETPTPVPQSPEKVTTLPAEITNPEPARIEYKDPIPLLDDNGEEIPPEIIHIETKTEPTIVETTHTNIVTEKKIGTNDFVEHKTETTNISSEELGNIDMSKVTSSGFWSEKIIQDAHSELSQLRNAEDARWFINKHINAFKKEFFFPTEGAIKEDPYGISVREYTDDDNKFIIHNAEEMKKIVAEAQTKFAPDAEVSKRVNEDLNQIIDKSKTKLTYAWKAKQELINNYEQNINPNTPHTVEPTPKLTHPEAVIKEGFVALTPSEHFPLFTMKGINFSHDEFGNVNGVEFVDGRMQSFYGSALLKGNYLSKVTDWSHDHHLDAQSQINHLYSARVALYGQLAAYDKLIGDTTHVKEIEYLKEKIVQSIGHINKYGDLVDLKKLPEEFQQILEKKK